MGEARTVRNTFDPSTSLAQRHGGGACAKRVQRIVECAEFDSGRTSPHPVQQGFRNGTASPIRERSTRFHLRTCVDVRDGGGSPGGRVESASACGIERAACSRATEIPGNRL